MGQEKVTIIKIIYVIIILLSIYFFSKNIDKAYTLFKNHLKS